MVCESLRGFVVAVFCLVRLPQQYGNRLAIKNCNYLLVYTNNAANTKLRVNYSFLFSTHGFGSGDYNQSSCEHSSNLKMQLKYVFFRIVNCLGYINFTV